MIDKLQKMKKQANNHQVNLEELILALETQGLSSENIHTMAQETAQKAAQIMKIYLGENPDASEAIEFLCLAEGGEVTHNETLSAMTKDAKNRKLTSKIKAILAEEKRHLQLCTKLAKQTAAKS